MTRALKLEDFATQMPPPSASQVTQPLQNEAAPEPTDDTMAAFEEGYRNGWEDCAKAEAEAHRKIGADLVANLADVALTYAEARADVLAALGPLFEEIAAQLLPRLAAEAVAPTVIAELRAIAETASDGRPVLLAPPGAMAALARLIETQDGLEIDLRAEPTFAEGQVSLRVNGMRRDVDLADAAQRMADAIRGFVAQERAETPSQPIRKGVA